MTKRLRDFRLLLVAGLVVLAAAGGALAAASTARSAGTCPIAFLQPFTPWGDTGEYLQAPGGNFEGTMSGWKLSGGAAVVLGNESFYVGSSTDSHSLALPTTSSSVTTSTVCVTSDTPLLRLFVRNNGLNGHTDGQLAVYVNFTGADGKPQQVKIAALKGTTAWAPSPPVSFIQYLGTALQNGYAYISFTIKPNDNHGSWQIDDQYNDPRKH